MEETKTGFGEWVKTHKKELTIAGLSLAGIALIYLGLQNKDELLDCWNQLKRVVSKTPAVPTVNIDTAANAAASVASVASVSSVELFTESVICVMERANTLPTAPFDVSSHIRNLPDGWHASPLKIAEAEQLGIILEAGQTFVDSYTKGESAA